jgi:hypothetical protein
MKRMKEALIDRVIWLLFSMKEEVILFDRIIEVFVFTVKGADGELLKGARVRGAHEAVDGEPRADEEAMFSHGFDGVSGARGPMFAAWAIDAGEVLGVELEGELKHLRASGAPRGVGPAIRGAIGE